MNNFNEDDTHMKKPPCSECARHREYYDYWHRCDLHYCRSNRRSSITGEHYIYKCWWYRRTPFCKFEQKGELL